MRFGKQLAPIIALSALALFGSLALSGCCAARKATAPAVMPEPEPEPFPATPDAAPIDDGQPIEDCDDYAPRSCCRALTSECLACVDEAQAEHQAWAARCSDRQPQPLPAIDCAAPVPLTPCCRALLPKCTDCVERNRVIDAAYRATCGVGEGASVVQ